MHGALARSDPPAPRNEQALPEPGQPPERTLGEFRILREIGRGGTGVAYEASLARLRAATGLPASHLTPQPPPTDGR